MSATMGATTGDTRTAGTGGKVLSAVREVFTNWRLALLGLTGLILSLASGWTTFDGMSNFTCPQNPKAFCLAPRVLSFMVTFGIQGIMLIAAWLIGETFAANNSSQRAHRAGWFKGGLWTAASLAVLAVFVAILSQDSFGFFDSRQLLGSYDWSAMRPGIGAGSLAVGIIVLFIILSRREIAGPYINGAMTILRNIPLWIMFLGCMATSVFFSFDSLFSTIFPQKERVRAAKLRVENQVTGMLSDVQAQLVVRRLEQTRSLFASAQWRDFEQNLDRLVAQAEAAPDAFQKQKLERVARSTRAQAEIRGLIVEATTRQRTLEAEQQRLQGELDSVAERRAPDEAKVALFEGQLITKRAEIVTAQIAAEGERQGVRGTGTAGAGPEFRRLRKVVQNLQLDVDEIETRLKAAQGRIVRVNDAAAVTQQRLTEIGKEQITLELQTREAAQRQAVFDQSGQNNLAGDLDAAGGIKALDVARNHFRRAPEEKGLDQLENLCTSLLANLRNVPSLKAGTSDVNCEPGDASILANAIFRIRAAEASFRVSCVAGENLPRGSANKLLKFGSVCIQNSGLAGADTEQFRDQLNRIALNRDDRAHRFVVSWNAFNDGNALAYLALAIAIAIDGLVFMSGLFGANVIRSPLSSLSAERLASTIDKALGSDKYDAARKALKAIADAPDAGFGSFRHQVLATTANEAPDIKNVLAAGMGLNAVRWDEHKNRYLVHADFTSYLNQIANRTIEDGGELRKVLASALAPEVRKNAELVMHEIHPVSSDDGFMGYVTQSSATHIGPRADVLRRALSAGTSLGVVHTSEVESENKVNTVTYWIRSPFWTCLSHLHASTRSGWGKSSGTKGSIETAGASDRSRAPLPPKTEQAQIQTQNQTQPRIQNLALNQNDEPARTIAVPSAVPFADKATIDHEEQNRRSAIESDVRAAMMDLFKVDDVTAQNELLADANVAGKTLDALRSKPGIIADWVVTMIDRTVADYLDYSKPVIRGYEDSELYVAKRERDEIVLAIAGRQATTSWQKAAAKLVAQIDAEIEIPTDDRSFINQSLERDNDLAYLKEQMKRLRTHERFDQELVTLIADADNAHVKLESLKEEQFGATATSLTKH